MFSGATSFNSDISAWDTSNVTQMQQTFFEATSFNGDISSWDISNVTDSSYMFYSATSFNQDLCAWDDKFPYGYNAENIFADSGCTNTSTPQEDQKGPFCASDCAVSTFVCHALFAAIILFLFAQISATLMPSFITVK